MFFTKIGRPYYKRLNEYFILCIKKAELVGEIALHERVILPRLPMYKKIDSRFNCG